MKKFIAMGLTFLLSFSLAACQKASITPDSAAAPTKLVIGLDENFPPMGFRDNQGNLVGFDIDMATEACKRMGITPEFQPIDWSTKELELSSKKVDLLWNGLTITETRKKTMQFTKPYLRNKQVILVKSDSPIATKADLSGKIVGLQKESTAVDAVQADAETAKTIKDLPEYTDNILAFTDLEIGRLDAVVVDEIVAKYYIATNTPPFVILTENFGDEEYGVGMRQEDTSLLETLQKALDEMLADGTSAQISTKWFDEDIIAK